MFGYIRQETPLLSGLTSKLHQVNQASEEKPVFSTINEEIKMNSRVPLTFLLSILGAGFPETGVALGSTTGLWLMEPEVRAAAATAAIPLILPAAVVELELEVVAVMCETGEGVVTHLAGSAVDTVIPPPHTPTLVSIPHTLCLFYSRASKPPIQTQSTFVNIKNPHSNSINSHI